MTEHNSKAPPHSGEGDAFVPGDYSIPSVELILEGVPSDRLIFEGIDPASGPTFTITEVARCFFSVTIYAIKRWEYYHLFDIEDDHFVARRGTKEGRAYEGVRIFTLPDIERMVHGLLYNGTISGERAGYVLSIVASLARLYKLIDGTV